MLCHHSACDVANHVLARSLCVSYTPQARFARRRVLTEREPSQHASSEPSGTTRDHLESVAVAEAQVILREIEATNDGHTRVLRRDCKLTAIKSQPALFPPSFQSVLKARLTRPHRARPWIFGAGAAAIAAALLLPDANSFARYIRSRQNGPKGLLTGGLAWLQHRTGVRSTFRSYLVCSVATLGSRTFLGAFKTWVELPEIPRNFPRRIEDILPANAEGARPPIHRASAASLNKPAQSATRESLPTLCEKNS